MLFDSEYFCSTTTPRPVLCVNDCQITNYFECLVPEQLIVRDRCLTIGFAGNSRSSNKTLSITSAASGLSVGFGESMCFTIAC